MHIQTCILFNMRSTFYLALSAVATLVVADNPNAFNIPKGGYKFTAGEPTTLKWNPNNDNTVSLKLQSGEVLTPDGGSTIACEYILWWSFCVVLVREDANWIQRTSTTREASPGLPPRTLPTSPTTPLRLSTTTTQTRSTTCLASV